MARGELFLVGSGRLAGGVLEDEDRLLVIGERHGRGV
jgi:hypothetical protein